jgi:lipopolysaccharide/colanic/teichoic acid biosynthesis glycosyltransferase
MTLLRGSVPPADANGWVPPGPRPVPIPEEGAAVGQAAARRPSARVLDVVVSSLAAVVLAPVMAVIALMIRCTSRGPALFRQVRVGQASRPFVMLKFRTMHSGADDRLHREYIARLLEEPAAACDATGLYKLVGDPRITPLGRWLRRTSLDELPQLLNVLRGEMALVGPRPVLPWEAALFDPRYQRRLVVPPGMTGLWQTSGRNKLTMAEALELDLRYVDTRSLRLDLVILCRTIPAILKLEAVR